MKNTPAILCSIVRVSLLGAWAAFVAACSESIPSAGADTPPAWAVEQAKPVPGKTTLRGFTVRELDEKTLEDAKKWGVNIVRCQLPLEYIAKTQNLGWEEAWKKNMEDLRAGLLIANRLKMTVVISLPYLGGEKWVDELGRWGNLEKLWDDDTNKARMQARWKEIASICRETHAVAWYDLLNEPLDRRHWPDSPPKWADWAQAIIGSIREVDSYGWIVIEPGPGGEMWDGIKTFPRLKDDKLIWSIHLYQPHKYTHQGVFDTKNTDLTKPLPQTNGSWPGEYEDTWGNGYWDKDRLEQLLGPVYAFTKANPDITIYVGEFSVARWAPNGEQYLKDCIDIFEKNGWNWTYHAFRESAIWSVEHTEEYSYTSPQLAPETTARGRVLEEYFRLNK